MCNRLLDAEFNYDAALRLVFPRNGDIYLDTGKDPGKETANTYLSAKFITSLSDDFSLTGGLGFLQLDAVNQPSSNENVVIKDEPTSTELDVSFDLDLNGDAGSVDGKDGKLTLSELISSDLDLEKVFQYELQGAAAMSFGVTTSLSGSAAIPSFSFDLSSLLPLFDYSNKQETAAPANASSFYFDNIKLNFGSYITQMLSPIVDGLDSILGPLYPIVDALYSDTQIFASIGIESTFDTDKDGHVTAIDLASWFADFYATIDKDRGMQLQSTIESTINFLDTIKGVMDLIHDLKALSEEGDFYIDYGSYELPTFSAADESVSTEDDVDLDEDGATADLTDDTATQANEGGSSGSGKSSSKFKDIMKQLDELGFQIPLIDQPKNAIKLLLGQDDVDLFTWTMPGMGMSSEIERSFPIYPGIEGIIEGGFGVDANLGFGFDTYGLNQWKQDGFKANDAWKVFDGFYVADWKDGKDIPEFSMEASMGAGLGLSALVVKSEITGGLEAAASFDLLDQGEIAGTSDGKIRGTEISSLIGNPLDLFELVGSLSAYLKAKVQVGVDAGLFQTWDTVWQETLAKIPLFEFGVGGSYGTGSASNGYLKGATIFWDGNQNLSLDPYEPSTITAADAAYNLRIDHRSFDLNRNGTIDASEGNLVAFGGIDTSTSLPLEVPFLAPLGQMVTPLTTLHTLSVANGYDEGAASAWIDQAFSLKGFNYLKRDPVLELNQLPAGASPAQLDPLAAYIGHIKLHFSWDVLVHSLQQLLSKQFPEEIKTEFGLIKAFSQELLGLPADNSINERLATAALRTSSRFKPDLAADDVPLAALAAGLAANASWDLSQQIDALFASASERTTSLADSLVAINQLKRDAFEHYRTNTESISQGLYRISDPEELERTVQQRLSAVYSSFIKDHPLQSASVDPANGLIKLLDPKDWGLSGATTLTSTPFTTIQSLEQLGISLSNQQLNFGLQLQPSSGGLTVVNQPDHPRVLVGLDSLGLPQRTADAALTYYIGIDQAPTSFLYDVNSRTGARFFSLGADLAPVLELSYRDDRRGDGDPGPGVIQASGAVAELEQPQQFKRTDQANVFSVGASNDADTRTAAVFLSTEVVSLASTSNQLGCLVLQDDEAWDPASLTLGQLLERIQSIAGSLENNDLPTLGSAMKFQRQLQFSTGERLVFLEVVDCTLAELGPSSASVASLGARILTLESKLMPSDAGLLLESPKSGLKLQLQLQNGEPGLSAFLARQQSLAPLIDFTGLGGRSVEGTLQLAREAEYNSTVGFYQVLDVSGAVIDPLTGAILQPADHGYQQAALHHSNLLAPLADLSIEDRGASSRELSIQADGIFAPYAVVDTGKDIHTFFAFQEANPDQLQHFQMLGDNTFVLEDLKDGVERDFDDLIVSFDPIRLAPFTAA